ncbi:MAG: LamG-like jellyroll fold domain-containing protein, partial [Armatimonadota bacterium]
GFFSIKDDLKNAGAEWVEGRIGHALRFDGRSGSVAIPGNWAYNNLRAFSLCAWVRLDALPDKGKGGTLVNKGPEAPVQHFWWWIGYPPNYSLILELGNEKHRWGRSLASDPQTWELGRWYHVATTFRSTPDGSTAVFYRDGKMIGERTIAEPFHSGQYDLKLGTYGGLHWLNGTLDEVKFWDRTLTADEILAEYRRAP